MSNNWHAVTVNHSIRGENMDEFLDTLRKHHYKSLTKFTQATGIQFTYDELAFLWKVTFTTVKNSHWELFLILAAPWSTADSSITLRNDSGEEKTFHFDGLTVTDGSGVEIVETPPTTFFSRLFKRTV